MLQDWVVQRCPCALFGVLGSFVEATNTEKGTNVAIGLLAYQATTSPFKIHG